MLQYCTTWRVLTVFFDNPLKRFGLKEISLSSGIAHTSVKNELKKLIKAELIQIEIEVRGKRKFPLYFSILENKFKNLKKINNEYSIRNCGLIKYLIEELMPNSIILFGSFSRGEDVLGSDIDLFIESLPKEVNIQKFEKKLNRKINLVFKANINYLKKEFLNNLINGVVVYGEIKLG